MPGVRQTSSTSAITPVKFLADISAGAMRNEKTMRNGAMFSAWLVAVREDGAEDRRRAKTIDQMFNCAGAVRRRFTR